MPFCRTVSVSLSCFLFENCFVTSRSYGCLLLLSMCSVQSPVWLEVASFVKLACPLTDGDDACLVFRTMADGGEQLPRQAAMFLQ